MIYWWVCATMIPMKQTIYLIRHGNTPGTESNLMYGATELPVTEEGLREIHERAEKGLYPSPDGAEIYTSGMLRTEQTLRAIYGDIDHRVAPQLREINVGKFEMMTVDQILEDDYGRAWLSGELTDPHFEGGDSISGFSARVNKGIRDVISECAAAGKERAILVIHGAVITFIMDDFFPDVSPDDVWYWTPVPGGGYRIDLEDGKPVSYELMGDFPTGLVPGRE